MEQAWELQLAVHCYASVAVKRLADVVPMLVRHELLDSLPEHFLAHMSAQYGDDRLAASMGEDPGYTARRATLTKAIARLEHALEVLQHAGDGDGDGGDGGGGGSGGGGGFGAGN